MNFFLQKGIYNKMGLFKSLFGTYSTKELKRIEPIKNAVLALEDKYAKMSEQELKSRRRQGHQRQEHRREYLEASARAHRRYDRLR